MLTYLYLSAQHTYNDFVVREQKCVACVLKCFHSLSRKLEHTYTLHFITTRTNVVKLQSQDCVTSTIGTHKNSKAWISSVVDYDFNTNNNDAHLHI